MGMEEKIAEREFDFKELLMGFGFKNLKTKIFWCSFQSLFTFLNYLV